MIQSILKKENKLIILSLFICFLLQQFGPSYHFSFGAIGLYALTLLYLKDVSKKIFLVSFFISSTLFLSYAAVVFKYNYYENFDRVFRYFLNSFLLFVLINSRLMLSPPRTWMIASSVFLLSIIAFIQVFFNRDLQVPNNFFALGENLGQLDSNMDSRDYLNIFRTNAIYSEPSYFGLILCCLYVFAINIKTKIRIIIIAAIILCALLSGSALAFIGLFCLSVMQLASGHLKQSGRNILNILMLVIAILVVIAITVWYEVSIIERLSELASFRDDSLKVRILNPFVLIWESVVNFDIFGVPSNVFQHYLYTRLYTNFSDFPGHNGFLGILISHGVLGLFYIYLIFRSIGSLQEFFLILLIGSQSGNLFSYEKVFLIIYMIFIMRGMRELKK